jgi:ribosomal protein S6|tara:strand:- start:373 stop:678 length:306 start_codon:yes stop_codon:yes gene_type:complete
VKQYEGLFILDTQDSAESIDAIIEALGVLIGKSGGKVLNEQKMDRRSFSRVANKKNSGGFYVNLVFEMEPGGLEEFRTALRKRPEMFRVQITLANASVVAD